jgi:hypothetical protein
VDSQQFISVELLNENKYNPSFNVTAASKSKRLYNIHVHQHNGYIHRSSLKVYVHIIQRPHLMVFCSSQNAATCNSKGESSNRDFQDLSN